MLVRLLLLAVFLLSIPVARAQTCSCAQELKFLTTYLERNYVGFKDKVPATKRAAYDKRKATLLVKAKTVMSQAYCSILMAEYIEGFHDGHIQLSSPQSHTPASDSIYAAYLLANTETIALTEAQKSGQGATGREGIYYNRDSTYKVAVVRSPNSFRDYAAVILSSRAQSWKPGQVKAELKQMHDSTFRLIAYYRDHSTHTSSTVWTKHGFGEGDWIKAGAPAQQSASGPSGDLISGRSLSPQTFYLRLGSFGGEWAPFVDSVIRKNAALLSHTPNLIVDLRGNGGGSDFTYQPVLKYLYTKPVVTVGVDVLATPENTTAWKHLFDDPTLPPDSKQEIEHIVDEMSKNPNKLVNINPDNTTRFDSVAAMPKKVVILVDRHVASSGEQFLFFAKESDKVTLMGENSAGVLDYANMRWVDFPCYRISVLYATTRSRRIDKGQGIDNVGIKPQIRLAPGADWVAEAQKYLER